MVKFPVSNFWGMSIQCNGIFTTTSLFATDVFYVLVHLFYRYFMEYQYCKHSRIAVTIPSNVSAVHIGITGKKFGTRRTGKCTTGYFKMVGSSTCIAVLQYSYSISSTTVRFGRSPKVGHRFKNLICITAAAAAVYCTP